MDDVTIRDLSARYDAAAPRWHGMIERLGYADAYSALVRAAFGPRRDAGRVLDVGTGTGALAAALAAQVAAHDLVLLDPSAAMLDAARRRLEPLVPGLRAVRGGVGPEELATETFDTVLCAHVLEHLPDPAAALRWMAGRLAPGGTLVLVANRPHWCTWIVRRIWRTADFRPEQMRALLLQAGFGAVTVAAFSGGPPSRTSCGYIARKP